jgi:NAD(P)H-dependent FMN reductase
MTKILGISGSLRAKSFNTALLNAAVALQPAEMQIEIASIKDIPLYDGDAEDRDGVPASVEQLKAKIAAADALLLVTPEYNNSIPGVFKNAIDWTTRPPTDVKKVWTGRMVGLIGASPGGYGTILSQQSWLNVLRTLGTRPYFGGRLQVSHADKVFDANGELVDDKIREQLRNYLRGFGEFVARK